MKRSILLFTTILYITQIIYGKNSKDLNRNEVSMVREPDSVIWLESDSFANKIEDAVGLWNQSRNYDTFLQKVVPATEDLKFLRKYFKNSHLLERRPIQLEFDRKTRSLVFQFKKAQSKIILVNLFPITLYINSHFVRFNPKKSMAENMKSIERSLGFFKPNKNSDFKFLESFFVKAAWAGSNCDNFMQYGLPGDFYSYSKTDRQALLEKMVAAGRLTPQLAQALYKCSEENQSGFNMDGLYYGLLAVGGALLVAWGGNQLGVWEKMGNWMERTFSSDEEWATQLAAQCEQVISSFRDNWVSEITCYNGKWKSCKFLFSDTTEIYEIGLQGEQMLLINGTGSCLYQRGQEQFQTSASNCQPRQRALKDIFCLQKKTDLDKLCSENLECIRSFNAIEGAQSRFNSPPGPAPRSGSEEPVSPGMESSKAAPKSGQSKK